MSAPLLETVGLTRNFGSFRAVDDVNLAVSEGGIHSVIGPNGAGKTTLFRLITGVLKPSTGRVRFAGEDVAGQRPYKIARKGLAQSFQMTTIFPRLTVLESVEAAIVARRKRNNDMWSWFHRSVAPRAMEFIDWVGLAELAGVRADELSHGDQRALEVALALATEPHMLLLDEPTAGMSAAETERTINLVARLSREEQLTVLFSEHDMDVVFGISDHVTVLHQGRIIADGSAPEVQANTEVMSIYLGSVAVEEHP
jgi:branched-chain amino acid transport system ATP-binding protein